jgi:hypothetical protein
MTTASPSLPATTPRLHYLAWAAAATTAHMLMMIPGYSEDGKFQTGEYLTIFAISLVVSLSVFLLVVPGGGAVTAMVLAVVALVSVLGFWAGLTLPLAAAGGLTAWRARQRDERSGLATAALALSIVAAAALVAVIVGDAAAN